MNVSQRQKPNGWLEKAKGLAKEEAEKEERTISEREGRTSYKRRLSNRPKRNLKIG